MVNPGLAISMQFPCAARSVVSVMSLIAFIVQLAGCALLIMRAFCMVSPFIVLLMMVLFIITEVFIVLEFTTLRFTRLLFTYESLMLLSSVVLFSIVLFTSTLFVPVAL